MKIEKISDYQIRCTLTKEDLARRGMKVSELAYGTEKSRALFEEMMEQAADRFGFVADDMPIMVEAIPVNSDCIVLMITKAEDPEELDTRFSNFAPSILSDEDDAAEEDDWDEEYEDEDVAGLFARIQEGGLSGLFESDYPGTKKVKPKTDSGKQQKYTDDAEYRIFSFPLLMDLLKVTPRIDLSHIGKNTLYRKGNQGYILLLHRQRSEDKHFAGICLMLSEYGHEEHVSSASKQYLEEQATVVIRDVALQTLILGLGKTPPAQDSAKED